MGKQNLTLMTDLYELTMMQGYFRNKDRNETVIFDAFYRNNPMDSGYSICAGLEQVIDYINNLHFEDDDIAYLRSLASSGKISWTICVTSIFPVIFTRSRKAASCFPENL